jgi:hypothetical protein
MHLTRRSCAGPLLITLAVFLVLLATPAIAQEAGVRKLEDYREVSPFYEVPVLTTGGTSRSDRNRRSISDSVGCSRFWVSGSFTKTTSISRRTTPLQT